MCSSRAMPAGHVAVTRPAAVRQSDRGDHADIRIHGRDDRVQRDPASNFPPLINANGAPIGPISCPATADSTGSQFSSIAIKRDATLY